jgi:predicted component of type VI protein secretion system
VDNREVSSHSFDLVADVSSADSAAVEPLLRGLVGGEITLTPDGIHVVATLAGESARDLNRSLLSTLRRVERRTRLRAEWTADGVTERFFDYIPKGRRPRSP